MNSKRIIKGIIFTILLLFENKIIVLATPVNNSFDDDNFYKCVIDSYNDVNNLSVSYETNLTDQQLSTITKMSCSGSKKSDSEKIISTKGIEKINNLKELDISGNKIQSMDFSHHTALTDLNIGDNFGGNEFKELDITKNTNLKKLSISKNKISNIDISYNNLLTNLSANYNNLSIVDISNNSLLTNLSLSNNYLKQINLSKNNNLKYLNLGYNKLTEIDLSKNNNLYHLSLEHNQLSNINLKNNNFLTNLYLDNNKISNINISNLNKLKIFYIMDNKLNDIDVSKNVELVTLGISNNNIKKIDLNNNLKLETLAAYNNNFMSLDLSKTSNLKISNAVNGIENQTSEVQYTKVVSKYAIDLKRFDSLLNASNVYIEQEGIEYDKTTGIISFLEIPQLIKYKYNTGNNLDNYKLMTVTLTLKEGNYEINDNTKEEDKTTTSDTNKIVQENQNKSTASSSSTNTKSNNEITKSPDTGDVLIYLAWFIGLGAISYSIYYFRSIKTKKAEN